MSRAPGLLPAAWALFQGRERWVASRGLWFNFLCCFQGLFGGNGRKRWFSVVVSLQPQPPVVTAQSDVGDRERAMPLRAGRSVNAERRKK